MDMLIRQQDCKRQGSTYRPATSELSTPAAGLAPGLHCDSSLGIALAGLSLMLQRGAWMMPDAIAGALYLMAGTIFPIAILPSWAEKIALMMPLTYWLELTRRALLGKARGASFPIAGTPTVLWLLVLTTGLTLVVCIGIFRVSDRIARERGQIDRVTGS